MAERRNIISFYGNVDQIYSEGDGIGARSSIYMWEMDKFDEEEATRILMEMDIEEYFEFDKSKGRYVFNDRGVRGNGEELNRLFIPRDICVAAGLEKEMLASYTYYVEDNKRVWEVKPENWKARQLN